MALLADAPALPRPDVLARTLLRDSTASQIGFATAALLAVGILISIVTTPDPLWWQLHFSRLGTFATFSGYVFNATIVLTGAGVVVFGLRLRREMVRHAGTPVLTNRRAATVVPILVALLGIHLSFVGFIPVNSNEFLHDRSSTGAVFCFVADPRLEPVDAARHAPGHLPREPVRRHRPGRDARCRTSADSSTSRRSS